jgi:hypothetical protein
MVYLAQTLAAAAPSGCPVFAAGHKSVCRAVRDDLTAAGITVLDGARDRNGADRALVQLAHTLAQRHGTRHFLVASNDHAFAHLPKTVTITVLTLHPHLVSDLLRARAIEVVTLPHPRAGHQAAASSRVS